MQENENGIPEETPELLLSYYQQFMLELKHLQVKSVKLEKLITRNSAKNWSPEKKKKMVKRLVDTNSNIQKLEPLLDQINVRINQSY